MNPALLEARRQAGRRLRLFVERWPRWYPRYQLWRGREIAPLGPNTAVAIVGFAGSGNTFSREALMHANPGIDVASHLHSWTAVANATAAGVPTVFLVRPPLDAIPSQLARFGEIVRPRWSLIDYARLYNKSYPYRDRMLIATFEEATRDVGSLTRRINERFGVSLAPFDDATQTEAVLAHMAEYSVEKFGAAEATVRGSTPSQQRDDEKNRFREALRAPELEPLLAAAEAAYRRMLDAR